MLFTVFLRLIPALAFIGRIHAAAIDPYPPHNHSISSILDHSSHSPACNDIKHCRTLWSVIYGCLATIFACTWVSFHPDVPSRYDTQCRILAIRVFSVVISFLVPELTVAKAVSQWWQLWEHEPAVKGWTRVHTYFTVMGGFFDSEPNKSESPTSPEKRSDTPSVEHIQPSDAIPEKPPQKRAESSTSPEDSKSPPNPKHDESESPASSEMCGDTLSLGEIHPELFESDVIPENPPHKRAESSTSPENTQSQRSTLPTRSAILDRSKRDTLGKLATVLQTTWFITQYTERWASHQPRTQLEVMTLAYAAINVIVYILWKEKPLGVQEPIDVRGHPIPVNCRTKGLRGDWLSAMGEAWASLTSGVDTPAGWTALPAVGILFGGVHCFAWKFPFPTQVEEMLWKVCAVYCTAYPILFPSVILLGKIDFFRRHEANWYIPARLAQFMGYATIFGYVICRIILAALTLASLRDLPPGSFDATNWTFFLPHVS